MECPRRTQPWPCMVFIRKLIFGEIMYEKGVPGKCWKSRRKVEKTNEWWSSTYKPNWAESTWDIPYLNRKVFLFHYQILKSYFFVINFSYFVIRFLLNSSVVKSDNKIEKNILKRYGISQADLARVLHISKYSRFILLPAGEMITLA